MSGSEITLGLVALVLVVFSLVVSLLIPRRDPGFPGRNLRVFALVTVLLVVGMLTAVEVLGESHHREGAEATATETGGGESGSGATETGQAGQTGGGPQGDPAAGKEIFTSAGCTSCHTLADAGSTATVGPNLDEVLKGKDAQFVEQSIVEPDAEVARGYSKDLMPETYGDQFDDAKLANLVAYLLQAAQS